MYVETQKTFKLNADHNRAVIKLTKQSHHALAPQAVFTLYGPSTGLSCGEVRTLITLLEAALADGQEIKTNPY